jgi:hypothetical protein
MFPLKPASFSSGKWLPLEVSGTIPDPRSFHTLTKIDDSHAVLFGGYRPGREVFKRSDEVYILDLKDMVIYLLAV